MCSTVTFPNRNIVCETVGALKKELPKLKLYKNKSNKDITDDSCLCTIELDISFDRAKIEYELDCMDYILVDL